MLYNNCGKQQRCIFLSRIAIINVSDFKNPVVKKIMPYDNTIFDKLKIYKSYLIACDLSGIYIFDITNNENPEELYYFKEATPWFDISNHENIKLIDFQDASGFASKIMNNKKFFINLEFVAGFSIFKVFNFKFKRKGVKTLSFIF